MVERDAQVGEVDCLTRHPLTQLDDRPRSDQLRAHADWLDWGETEADCRKSDDVLDAVLCAVIAGLAARQLVTVPEDSRVTAARSEG